MPSRDTLLVTGAELCDPIGDSSDGRVGTKIAKEEIFGPVLSIIPFKMSMRWPDGQIGPRMAWQPPSGPVTPRRHSKRRARWHGMGG